MMLPTMPIFDTSAPRPFKDFSRLDIFKRSEEDASDEAQWNTARELIQRTLEARVLEERIEELAKRTERARQLAKMAESKVKNLEVEDSQEKVLAANLNAKSADRYLANCQQELERAQAKLVTARQDPKTVSSADVRLYYRERYQPEWDAMIARYKVGDLFAAQSKGWGSFLVSGAEDIRADMKLWTQLEGLALYTGNEDGLQFKEMHEFFVTRILPSAKERKSLEDTLEEDDNPGRYWKAWHNYNLQTFKHKWTDDSNVAYDLGSFDPSKPGGRP